MTIDTDVTELKGAGRVIGERLSLLGIKTIGDLLMHYPRRYEDFSNVTPIKQLAPGRVTVRGVVTDVNTRRTRKGVVTEALVREGEEAVKAVWFNQPYLAKQLTGRGEVFVSGDLAFKYQQYALQNPVVEMVNSFPKDTARIVSVYPLTSGVTSKQIRRLMAQAIKAEVPDPISRDICRRYKLMGKMESIRQIHFPDNKKKLDDAKYRIGFEEVYLLQLLMRQIRQDVMSQPAPQIVFDSSVAEQFLANLNFDLTDDQRKSAWKIVQDMTLPQPMNRLLQGDVGSGKTVVAAFAAAQAAAKGYQVVFLAPTEVLARQHLATLELNLAPMGVDVELLVGSLTKGEKLAVQKKLNSGKSLVVVGTHALLTPGVEFSSLGLVVVDEQHRFGVDQRQVLRESSPLFPHMLSMSATPIPRSLALTVYGDLDISSIRHLPPGRKPIHTEVVTNARITYGKILEQIKLGQQVYVVCPLIEDSDKLEATSVDKQISVLKKYWKQARIEGLHGRMKPAEKAVIMDDFRRGKIDVMVSTTVVEVGLDVPNATIMLVEDAERFGLATLHQLRGRVGRGQQQAYCYLKTNADKPLQHRLRLMERYHDGFVLAEKDLEYRGAGELYGQRQHGELDLRMAKLTDTDLIKAAQSAADVTGNIEPDSDLATALRPLYNKIKTN